ncbi:DUF2786 domain-containing protein [Streptomyces sp. NPDC026673]|uniref:DUF2786 domain-containing protein n=1 Tax=Streptomyces sp. NPDC026673 TaxID=3155724 RepID=UPI0033EFB6EB
MRDAMTVVEAAFAGALGAAEGDEETALDTGASAMGAAEAGWEEVSRAVAAATGGVLRGCRARGWEDADLLRMARRELRPEHVRLAGLLTEAGSADAGGLLSSYGAAERLDRFAVATAVLELVRLLGRLPRITPPSAPGPVPAPSGAGHPMLRRIRALLAKAESTLFPEEAEALTAKAQHLMARHSVDEALVAGTAPGAGPGARRIGVDRPYEAPKALLLDAVAAANRCRAVWSAEFGFSTVVGWEPDLDAVEVLYTSLLVQAEAAMRRGGGPEPAAGPGRKGGRGGKGGKGGSPSRDFRESFLIAYAGRIGERLAAASRDAAEEAAEGSEGAEVLPVLAAREVAVGRAADEMFPQTRTERLKGRDREGWEHGTAAADRAAFHGPVGPSRRSRG